MANMMVLLLLQLLFILHLTSSDFPLTCPSKPHWDFCAKIVCNDKYVYRCLWDANYHRFLVQCSEYYTQQKVPTKAVNYETKAVFVVFIGIGLVSIVGVCGKKLYRVFTEKEGVCGKKLYRVFTEKEGLFDRDKGERNFRKSFRRKRTTTSRKIGSQGHYLGVSDNPASIKMDSKKEKVKWMSLPTSADEIQSLFWKGVKHPAMELASTAIKMKRSPNQVFILLVGLSGAGKSSTINYLFGDDIAATSDDRSKTRQTTEYVMLMKSEAWRIQNLLLSIVDSPGFSDTDGKKQNALNILTIKEFFKQHPNTKKGYPNIVMITCNINDNRFNGKDSTFVKMLKSIKVIDVVDDENPNVVVVITHACSLGSNVEKWKEKVQTIKEKIKYVVQIHTGVEPEVVVQENKPDDYNLIKDGDYYLLPNKERQPLNLFEACKNILKTTNDKIGNEALVCGFRTSTKKVVIRGRTINSSYFEEKEMESMETELDKESSFSQVSEVSKMLDKYKKEHNEDFIKDDISKLDMILCNLVIIKTKILQSMSINQLEKLIHPTPITPGMANILGDVFGIQYEQMSDMECIVGRGFNMFTDSTTIMPPLELEIADKRFPTTETRCSSQVTKCRSVKDTEHYIKDRLAELNIGGNADIDFGAFHMQIRAGYNNIETQKASSANSMTGSSFLLEHRIKKIELKHFKATERLKKDVKNLPLCFKKRDKENLKMWKGFIEKWGTHVIVEHYLGGSVSGTALVKNKSSKSEENRADQANAAINNKVFELDAGYKKSSEDIDMANDCTFESLEWNGGDGSLYTNSLEDVTNDNWKRWIKSIKSKPVPLLSSLKLYKMNFIVSEINPTRGKILEDVVDYLAFKRQFNCTETNTEPGNRRDDQQSDEASGCFDQNSLVMIPCGNPKKMKDLKARDTILTVTDDGIIQEDKIITWLHRKEKGQYSFVQLKHTSGIIKMTKNHIIFRGKNQTPCQAADLIPGDDIVYVRLEKGHLKTTFASILSKENVVLPGLYAPLTYSGRIIVDGVAVSCYCDLQPIKIRDREIISSHTIAHFGMMPLRIAYLSGVDINEGRVDKKTGLHKYAKWIKEKVLG